MGKIRVFNFGVFALALAIVPAARADWADCPDQSMIACPPLSPSIDRVKTSFDIVRDFGALGKGIKSVCEDTRAIRSAVQCITELANGGVIFIPPTPNFYAFTGTGIKLPDNITIYGVGPNRGVTASEIKHVNPQDGKFLKGVIFYGNDFGPFKIFDESVDLFYSIEAQKAGRMFVRMNAAAAVTQAANLTPGKVVLLGGNKAFKDGTPSTPYFAQVELNEVERVEKDIVFFKYPLSSDFTVDEKGVLPVILDLNNKNTSKSPLGGNKSLAKNVVMHDLILSQADNNLIAGLPLQLPIGMEIAAPVHGGSFDSKFHDLTLYGYSGYMPAGNLFGRSNYFNLNENAYRKFVDVGYSSSNLVIHDVKWHFRPSAFRLPVPTDESFVYVNQGSHDILMKKISVDGKWDGNGIIRIAEAAFNLKFIEWKIDLPALVSPTFDVIRIKDDDAPFPVHDVEFSQFDATANTISSFVYFMNGLPNTSNRNVSLTNVNFTGKSIDTPINVETGFGIASFKNVKINGTTWVPTSQKVK